MPIEIKGNYLRIRLRDPKEFRSFATVDPGKPGGFQLIRGILKSSGKRATQAERYELAALADGRQSTWRSLLDRMDKFGVKMDPKSIIRTKRLLDSRGIKIPANLRWPLKQLN